MATFKCKNCGDQIEVKDDQKVTTCPYCGKVQEVPHFEKENKDSLENTPIDYDGLLRKGETYLKLSNFEAAKQVFKKALPLKEKCGEAYFGFFLAEFSFESFESVIKSSDIGILKSSTLEKAKAFSDTKTLEKINKMISEVNINFLENSILLFNKYVDRLDDGRVANVISSINSLDFDEEIKDKYLEKIIITISNLGDEICNINVINSCLEKIPSGKLESKIENLKKKAENILQVYHNENINKFKCEIPEVTNNSKLDNAVNMYLANKGTFNNLPYKSDLLRTTFKECQEAIYSKIIDGTKFYIYNFKEREECFDCLSILRYLDKQERLSQLYKEIKKIETKLFKNENKKTAIKAILIICAIIVVIAGIVIGIVSIVQYNNRKTKLKEDEINYSLASEFVKNKDFASAEEKLNMIEIRDVSKEKSLITYYGILNLLFSDGQCELNETNKTNFINLINSINDLDVNSQVFYHCNHAYKFNDDVIINNDRTADYTYVCDKNKSFEFISIPPDTYIENSNLIASDFSCSFEDFCLKIDLNVSGVEYVLKYDVYTESFVPDIEGFPKNKSLNFAFYDKVILEEPPVPGLKFLGWYTDSSFAEESKISVIENINYDVKVYARWEQIMCNVKFLDDDGTLIDERNVLSYERFDLPTCKKEKVPYKSFNFEYWLTDDGKQEFNSAYVYKDTVFQAKYYENTYPYSFTVYYGLELDEYLIFNYVGGEFNISAAFETIEDELNIYTPSALRDRETGELYTLRANSLFDGKTFDLGYKVTIKENN